MNIAALCMGLTSYTSNPKYDAIGSLLVGGLLGAVASFIIYTNVAALVGQSIPRENLNKINDELESDIMVIMFAMENKIIVIKWFNETDESF